MSAPPDDFAGGGAALGPPPVSVLTAGGLVVVVVAVPVCLASPRPLAGSTGSVFEVSAAGAAVFLGVGGAAGSTGATGAGASMIDCFTTSVRAANIAAFVAVLSGAFCVAVVVARGAAPKSESRSII